jgi:hypothetical protein
MLSNFSRTKTLGVSLLAVLILTTACTHQQPKPSITWLYGYGRVEKVNGKVKSLTDKRLGSSNTMPYWIYTFDEKGDIIRIEDIFKNGTDTNKYTTAYDKDGKRTESTGLYLDAGKPVKEVYKYDTNGWMTGYIYDANKPGADTNKFVYDKAGNLAEHRLYANKKPLWIYKFKYLYNKEGVMTGVEQSTATWRDNFKTVTKDTTRYLVFDSENNWVRAVHKGDTMIRKIEYY